MKIAELFPSNYIKTDDIPAGKPVSLVIKSVELETIGDDEKAVLYFLKLKKGLPLNKTNATVLAETYGDDTDDWAGKAVLLKRDMTDYQGKRVPCIRLQTPSDSSGESEEIPF